MMRIPGALGLTHANHEAIDAGTSTRHRNHAPAHRARQPHSRPTTPPPLSAREQQVLAALDTAGIDDLNERAMFMAQVSHESGGFTRLHENLHYSAATLLRLFPTHFADIADAQGVVDQGTDAIAERIYGGRADLGNATAGDGTRYAGRGFIQLTGRANYAAAGTALGLDLVNHPELAEDPANASRIAIWFWNNHHVAPPARLGNVRAVTRRVNGGLNGLADRERRYRQYLERLPRPAASAPTVVPALPTAPLELQRMP